jgi:hypothetical protein
MVALHGECDTQKLNIRNIKTRRLQPSGASRLLMGRATAPGYANASVCI